MIRLWLMVIFCIWGVLLHAQVKVIFDTDIGSDCDDAGAMAVLHKLADKGELTILGTIFSSNANPYGIGVCAAINSYYGRANIALAQLHANDTIGDPRDSYSKAIASDTETYGHSVVNSGPDLVQTYKKLLRGQDDKSVTIVSVGHPVGLYQLINDPDGKQLVKEKVLKWIAMTHTNTLPESDWNFGKNGTAPYLKAVLANWPTDVYFSGAGKDIITGNKKLPMVEDGNPVKEAYRLWGDNALVKGRSSWDQVAVLFAARPEYFDVQRGTLSQNDALETKWGPGTAARHPAHFKIIPNRQNDEIAKIIEDLMSASPFED